MYMTLQHIVNEKGKNLKLVDGPDFRQLRVVLVNVMKECMYFSVKIQVTEPYLKFLSSGLPTLSASGSGSDNA